MKEDTLISRSKVGIDWWVIEMEEIELRLHGREHIQSTYKKIVDYLNLSSTTPIPLSIYYCFKDTQLGQICR